MLLGSLPSGLPAGKIGAQLGITSTALSFHLKELAHAGLPTSRQERRFVIYIAQFATMRELVGFLTQNCCAGVPCGIDAPVNSCEPTAGAKR